MKSKKRVECPTCGESFHLENWLRVGVQLLCPYCEDALEVVQLKPLVVDCVYSAEMADLEEGSWKTSVWKKNNSH